ncbi:hypothetical protein JCM19045_3225 [Bacillus sp. JCM 19045]|nr:hypothetical protein JCM19045_3225 [Bacillus sp. JCM 19045]
MKRINYLLLTALLASVVIGAFLFYQMFRPEIVSEEDIQTLTLERYHPDEIETLSYNSQAETYELTFRRGAGLYEMVLSGTSGAVQSLTLLEEQNEPIDEEQAQSLLNDSYDEPVDFLTTELIDGRYLLTFTVNGRTGTAEMDAYSGQIISNTLEQEAVILSPDRAGEIALETVPGTIEDIEQETRNDRLVYEVEIEDTGRDDDALVIIDAYSGEVISVIWD